MQNGMPDHELLARYRENYGLGEDVELSVAQVRDHLTLERRLTSELLATRPETRQETFERAYDELYRSLPWLADVGEVTYPEMWVAMLGPPPKRVYEIGSGAGRLARRLAEEGYDVEATDISSKRGGGRQESERLRWTTTDGVHVEEFAERGPYDAVISDQVVEHLHPEDLVRHLTGCRRILGSGGRLVFKTPHSFTGPHDIGRVFGFAEPVGMHLREYTNRELRAALREAGFDAVRAVLPVPVGGRGAVASRAWLGYQLAAEAALGRFAPPRRAKVVARMPRPLRPYNFLVATTGSG
jgi:2-polyprenyl-3-methyl-5-hydroxy-6-metoxy-1,4-benzoquinol methylase